MSRTLKKEITVNETEIKVGETIKMGKEAPIQDQIAVSTLIEDQIAQLKAVSDVLKENIRTTKYDDIVKELVSKGLLSSMDDAPVITISTKMGSVIKVSLSADIDTGFEVSKEVSSKEILDTVVPDKYKKVSTTLDKKAIEADFEDGTLPDVLKGYCSKCPVEITKTRKSVSKK